MLFLKREGSRDAFHAEFLGFKSNTNYQTAKAGPQGIAAPRDASTSAVSVTPVKMAAEAPTDPAVTKRQTPSGDHAVKQPGAAKQQASSNDSCDQQTGTAKLVDTKMELTAANSCRRRRQQAARQAAKQRTLDDKAYARLQPSTSCILQ